MEARSQKAKKKERCYNPMTTIHTVVSLCCLLTLHPISFLACSSTFTFLDSCSVHFMICSFHFCNFSMTLVVPAASLVKKNGYRSDSVMEEKEKGCMHRPREEGKKHQRKNREAQKLTE